MMKKLFLFLCVSAALGVAMNSCISQIVVDQEVIEPDEPDEPDDPDMGVINRSFRFVCFANFSGNILTYAYPDMSHNIPPLIWSNTLENAELNVGIFLKGESSGQQLLQNYELGINSLGNNEGAKVVTVTTNEKNGVVYAYYPYQNTVSGTTLSYRINNVQDQSVADSIMDRSLNSNMLMISEPSSSFVLNGGYGVVYFKNVFSILRFRVNFSQEMILLQPIKKITVYIANKDNLEVPLDYTLAGNYTIDLSKAPGTSNYTGPVFTSNINTITAQLSNSLNITSNIPRPSVWLVVNPNVISPDDRLVSIVELDGYKIISSNEIEELVPNTIHDIHIVTTKANTITDYVNTNNYFPKAEASNCYVIKVPGFCQIPLYTIGGERLYGDTVEWLWASKANGDTNFNITELIDPASISEINDNDFVRFRVGTNFGVYTKGNVILALKENGVIKWTWHIWITDDLEDVMYEDGTSFLDRNIGAFAAQMEGVPIDNYGFMYQWGRKDPFFGGDGINNESTLSFTSNYTKLNGDNNWSVVHTPQSSVYAIQNPMTFISPTTSSNDEMVPVDWLNVDDPQRWSDSGKTDQDPCPNGYKVPDRDKLHTLREAWLIPSSSFLYFKRISNFYWEYNYIDYGSITAWPAAGKRQGRDGVDGNIGGQLLSSGTTSTKGECFYWTSSPAVFHLVPPGGSHRMNTFFTGMIDVLNSLDDLGDNADAYPIRCVKY